MIGQVRDELQKIPDDELLELLDAVSDEVKRRNTLGGSVAAGDKEGLQRSLEEILGAMVTARGPAP